MRRLLLVMTLAVMLVLAISIPGIGGTAPYAGVALYAGNATSLTRAES